MADPFTNNLTTLARRLKPFFLGAVRAAPGVAAVMLNRIILIPASDADPGIYPKSAAGLAQALAAEVAGDSVWLPSCALGGSQTVPAGGTLVGVSRKRCVIAGQVTLGDGATLENLSITWAGSVGVVGPDTGTAYLYSCSIAASNTGDAAGVQSGDGDLEIWDSRISATSSSGDGYGVQTGGTGGAYMDGGWLSGSTAPAGGVSDEPPQIPSYSWYETTPIGKVIDCGSHGITLPEGWNEVGFDDSGWRDPVQGYAYNSQDPPEDVQWIGDHDPEDPDWQYQGKVVAYRHEFELDTPPIHTATLEIIANDIVNGVWINGELAWAGHAYYHWLGWEFTPNAYTDPVQAVLLDPALFDPSGTNCIAIQFADETVNEDAWDCAAAYKLTLAFPSTANLITNGVRMYPVIGEPAQGDRSAWDVLDYQLRHANDIDSAIGIHHTLGDDAGQAAPGDHTHAHPDLTEIDTDDSTGAIHHTLGTGATQAAAGDHLHDDRYYTETELQTSGQAQVHWDNITNEPATYPPDAHSHDLADLGDVNVGTPDEGDVLTWDASPGEWIASPPMGGSTLDHDHSGDAGDGNTFDAANLTSGAAGDGDVLTADGAGGAAWEAPTGGGALDDLTDVNAPAPDNGDVLTWDSTPGEWVASPPAGGANALDDLTDVSVPTPGDGDVLTYNDGTSTWEAAAPTGGAGVDPALAIMSLLGWG